jgi:hypothetical protein
MPINRAGRRGRIGKRPNSRSSNGGRGLAAPRSTAMGHVRRRIVWLTSGVGKSELRVFSFFRQPFFDRILRARVEITESFGSIRFDYGKTRIIIAALSHFRASQLEVMRIVNRL